MFCVRDIRLIFFPRTFIIMLQNPAQKFNLKFFCCFFLFLFHLFPFNLKFICFQVLFLRLLSLKQWAMELLAFIWFSSFYSTRINTLVHKVHCEMDFFSCKTKAILLFLCTFFYNLHRALLILLEFHLKADAFTSQAQLSVIISFLQSLPMN